MPWLADVQFAVAREGHVSIAVLDVMGRVVTMLAEGTYEPGRYAVAWDGIDRSGPVAPGLYMVRLTAPDRTRVRKFAVTR